MPRETVTVRLQPETRQSLDEIAAALDRDRSHVINEALAAYIDVHHWQIEHIKQGLREAESEKFASEKDVQRTIEKLTRK